MEQQPEFLTPKQLIQKYSQRLPKLTNESSPRALINWLLQVNKLPQSNPNHSCEITYTFLQIGLQMMDKKPNPIVTVSQHEKIYFKSIPMQIKLKIKDAFCFGFGIDLQIKKIQRINNEIIKTEGGVKNHYIIFIKEHDKYLIIQSWYDHFSLEEWWNHINNVGINNILHNQSFPLTQAWKSPWMYLLHFMRVAKFPKLLNYQQFPKIMTYQENNLFKDPSTQLLMAGQILEYFQVK